MKSNLDKNSIIGFISVTFCASFFLVVLGPLGVFLNNVDSFTVGLVDILKYLPVIASCIFLTLLTTALFLPEKLSNIFVRGIALVALSSWVISSFFYGEYGRLDGKELSIISWSWLGFFQLLALVTLFLIIVKIKKKAVYLVVYFVFFVGVFSSVIGISNLEEKFPHPNKTGFHSGFAVLSPDKNVLHVVLDALQSDLFMSVIKNDEALRRKFEGFVFYEDALSVYPSTEMSIPMLITGEVYRNKQSKKDFLRKIKKQHSGVNRLEGIGYKLDAHTICKGIITSCTPISPRVVNTEGVFSEIMLLLDIYIFKSMPDWIKPFIYNKGNWLILNNVSVNEYLKLPQVGVAHLIFSKFIKELEVGEEVVPRYKLFHSLVTHHPLRLDADCNIVSQDKIAGLSHVEFVTCGIQHFAELLDKLKLLDVYDNTMIILSSDHGAVTHNDALDLGEFTEMGISSSIVGLASSTLLVKPFNKRGSIKISDAQVSLRDISRTILVANDIAVENAPNEEFPALNILNMDAEIQRKREYLHYEWEHKFWHESKLPYMNVYTINGNIKNPLSWEVPLPRSYSLDEIGVLICNHQVKFSESLSNVKVPYGLSAVEKWGRWTNSEKVKILFNMNTERCSQNKLLLKLRGFVTSDHTSQRAEVLLNDIRIGEVVINSGEKNPREFAFSIPPELILQAQVNSLVFHIENPVSPKSVSESKDTRLLGLGFESMVFQ